MDNIKLFYHGPNKSKVNFGDALSPIIVREITCRNAVYANIFNCELIALGSILDTYFRWRPARALLGSRQPVKVWGSGFIKDGPPRRPNGLMVAAVRGPLTRERLGLSEDTPLGDPGLLISQFVKKSRTPRFAWGIVPHMADINDRRLRLLTDQTRHATLIRLDGDPMTTLRRIADCECIVSTSLHGLISADALGIPNWWLRLGDRLIGGSWKFEDYFASVGRIETTPLSFPMDCNLDRLGPSYDPGYLANIPPMCDRLRAALQF